MHYLTKYSDKLAHFFGGYFFYSIMPNMLTGIILVAILGVAKETIVDDTPDWWDAFWTVMGGIAGIIILGRH